MMLVQRQPLTLKLPKLQLLRRPKRPRRCQLQRQLMLLLYLSIQC
jgi:hypothetical protein